MATVVNDRDVLLQAAGQRYTASSASALLIAASAPAFTVDVGGTPTPSSITFNAVRLNVSGTATFSTSDGSTLTVNGDTATLAYANMPSGSNSTTVTVTVNDGGTVYSRSTTITKVRDGQSGTGTTGQRGAGTYYASGGAWSDTAAHLATPGETVVDDRVTIWNGANFAEQRRWDGSNWVPAGLHVPGDVIVPGTLTGNRVKAGTLEIFGSDGVTPILTLGGGLRPGFEAPGTKNSDFQNGTLTIGGDNLADNSSFEKASGGMAVGFGVYNNNTGAEPSTVSDGVGRSGSGRSQIVSWTGGHNWQKGIVGTVCRGGWTPNRTYIISIWAKTTSLLTAGGLTLEWNSGPASAAALLNPNLGTSWQRYAWRITWGSSVETGGHAYISVHLGSGAGNVHFDDLMVVEGEVLPAYAPSVTEAARYASWPNVDGDGRPADNASADLVLIGRGVAINGNTLTRTQSGTGWGQADCYSKDCYTGGAFVTGVLTNLSAGVMIGLNNNADADNDAHYTTINYAIYGATSPGGAIEIYEHGSYVATGATWAVGDVLGVFYDGSFVRYTKNGIELRKVAASPGLSMFFDSSFITQGRNITNVRFGPMSDNSAGVAANAAIPGINNAIADKLSKSAGQVMTGYIALQTGGGIVAGSMSWDANGLRTGGSGVAMTPYGIVAHNGTKYTFVLEAANGNATFAGELSAAHGTFGSLRIAAGGYIAQGAHTGAWAYPAAGNTGWTLHPNGLLFGDYYGGKYVEIHYTGNMYAPGFKLENGQLTLINTIMIDPQINSLGGATLTLSSSPSTMYFTYTRTITGGNAGTITANASGTGLTYAWAIEGNMGNRVLYSVNGYSSSNIQLSVNGGGAIGMFDWTVTCTVTDSKGLSVTKTMIVTVELT